MIFPRHRNTDMLLQAGDEGQRLRHGWLPVDTVPLLLDALRRLAQHERAARLDAADDKIAAFAALLI